MGMFVPTNSGTANVGTVARLAGVRGISNSSNAVGSQSMVAAMLDNASQRPRTATPSDFRSFRRDWGATPDAPATAQPMPWWGARWVGASVAGAATIGNALGVLRSLSTALIGRAAAAASVSRNVGLSVNVQGLATLTLALKRTIGGSVIGVSTQTKTTGRSF